MRLLEKISINLAFGLVVLLFFLSLVSSSLLVPPWVQVLGRMHMLLLHLPIGIWAVLAVLAFFVPPTTHAATEASFRLLLALAALTSALAAFMGFVLAQEGGYAAEGLLLHRRAGIAVAALGLLGWYLYVYRPLPLAGLRVSLIAMLGLITLTGHWGGDLTHGEDFVLAPLRAPAAAPSRLLSDTLYIAHIEPLLADKCGACHNDNKQKGGLNLSSYALAAKGGEHGPIWDVNDPDQSPMLVRARLPLEHEEHMPPEGKPQLSGLQIELLEAWIAAGASPDQSISSLPPDAELAQILPAFQPKEPAPSYGFDAADAALVAQLNSPFCRVTPIAPGRSALQAKFFIRQQYDPQSLSALQAVAGQLVHLDMSHMPLRDEALPVLARFTELRTLLLNGTALSGAGLDTLRSLVHLEKLGLVGLPVGQETVARLATLPALQSLYLWDTPVSQADIAMLAAQVPTVDFDTGFAPDTSERLQLSPPIIKGGEAGIFPYGSFVTLHSFFPGSEIRYTLDGSDPDSLESPLYTQPEIPVTDYTTIKARCFMPGWLSSEVVDFVLFPASIKPVEAQLLQAPMSKYKHSGAVDFFDGKRGSVFTFRESYWVGFDEKPLELLLQFPPGEASVNRLAFSYLRRTGDWIFPPARLEVWAGDDTTDLSPVLNHAFPDLSGHQVNSNEGFSIDLPAYDGRYIKVILHPIKKLPRWHNARGKPGRLFVDELFLYRVNAGAEGSAPVP